MPQLGLGSQRTAIRIISRPRQPMPLASPPEISAASGRARGKVVLPCSRSGSKTALEAAQHLNQHLENPWFSTYPSENLLFQSR